MPYGRDNRFGFEYEPWHWSQVETQSASAKTRTRLTREPTHSRRGIFDAIPFPCFGTWPPRSRCSRRARIPPKPIRQWQFAPSGETLELALREVEAPAPAAHEVAVRVHAVSLNRRDLMMVAGRYGRGGTQPNSVPLSDGAGEVVAVGAERHALQGRRPRRRHLLRGLARRRADGGVARDGARRQRRRHAVRDRRHRRRRPRRDPRAPDATRKPRRCRAPASPRGSGSSSAAASRPATSCCSRARAACRCSACSSRPRPARSRSSRARATRSSRAPASSARSAP